MQLQQFGKAALDHWLRSPNTREAPLASAAQDICFRTLKLTTPTYGDLAELSFSYNLFKL